MQLLINKGFSNPSKIECDIPQSSTLDPLFFNTKLINMFYECEDSDNENWADDTTPYTCAPDIYTVISKLQFTSDIIFALKNFISC